MEHELCWQDIQSCRSATANIMEAACLDRSQEEQTQLKAEAAFSVSKGLGCTLEEATEVVDRVVKRMRDQ